MSKTVNSQYEQDFYAWITHNVQLLRDNKLSEVDIEHIAEEMESMGKSEKRELINRLALLMAHMLKWKFQLGRQSKSWKLTIQEQRFELVDLLKESPSLRFELEKKLLHAYRKARLLVEKEIGIEQKHFPKKYPFSLKQLLDSNYFPK